MYDLPFTWALGWPRQLTMQPLFVEERSQQLGLEVLKTPIKLCFLEQTENEQEDTWNSWHTLDKTEGAGQRACNVEAMLCSCLDLSSSSSSSYY